MYDHWKVIVQASQMGRAFHITPGGNGHVPFHIMKMVTSCATVIYKVPIEGFEGASPLMAIHASSLFPKTQEPSDVQTTNGKFSNTKGIVTHLPRNTMFTLSCG